MGVQEYQNGTAANIKISTDLDQLPLERKQRFKIRVAAVERTAPHRGLPMGNSHTEVMIAGKHVRMRYNPGHATVKG
jgi:hypothetical protein